jgi:hypothetical protein
LLHGGIHKRTPSAGYLSQVLQLDFPLQFQVCIMWPARTKPKLLIVIPPKHLHCCSEIAANCGFRNAQTQSSWMDEILDVPEGLFKPGSHRRSASESMVFLNTGYANFSNENLGEEQFDSQSAALIHSHSGSLDFDRYRKRVFRADYLVCTRGNQLIPCGYVLYQHSVAFFSQHLLARACICHCTITPLLLFFCDSGFS